MAEMAEAVGGRMAADLANLVAAAEAVAAACTQRSNPSHHVCLVRGVRVRTHCKHTVATGGDSATVDSQCEAATRRSRRGAVLVAPPRHSERGRAPASFDTRQCSGLRGPTRGRRGARFQGARADQAGQTTALHGTTRMRV